MIQQLADRDLSSPASNDAWQVLAKRALKAKPPFLDELQHDRGRERLGDASDPKSLVRVRTPSTRRGLQTLLTHKPRFANVITADALDTLTHEMLHAIGWGNEALVECLAMQTSVVMAYTLGLGFSYGQALARQSLKNYPFHPPSYVNKSRCREGGAWDVLPDSPSPPWHDYPV